MPVPSIITGPTTGHTASVTPYGQLVTGPVAYNDVSQVDMTSINTAYNLIEPSANQDIVLTNLIISTDRLVGVNGALITIYEADTADTTTETEIIIRPEILKNNLVDLPNLNLFVNRGLFVNAKTNDNNVSVTALFYKIPVEG